jgi:hypothetical protein
MTRTSTTTRTPDQQTAAIVAIYWPWLEANTERTPFTGTLADGTQWNARMPLAAAAEIEEAGYDIRIAGRLDA